MKKFLRCVCLGVLSAQAMMGYAQTTNTNSLPQVRDRIPSSLGRGSNSMAKAGFNPNKPAFAGFNPNKPAFEKYGLDLMLSEINNLRTNWQLDVPEPWTTNNVAFSHPHAGLRGVTGTMVTRDGRFHWSFIYNRVYRFWDTNYFPWALSYLDDKTAQRSKVPSRITAREAEAIARKCLYELGTSEKKLQLITPPEVFPYKFKGLDGKLHPLALFHVAWHDQGCEQGSPSVTFDISGITSQVVRYYNTNLNTPSQPRPTNYYEILGGK